MIGLRAVSRDEAFRKTFTTYYIIRAMADVIAVINTGSRQSDLIAEGKQTRPKLTSACIINGPPPISIERNYA